MVKKKYKSKRTSLADKHKVKRRVVEHHRKQRKESRKNPNKLTKKKKDPGIPNAWPFKQELLTEIARAKERQENAMREKKAQQVDQLRALRSHQEEGGTARSYQELMSQSEAKQSKYIEDADHNATSSEGADFGSDNTQRSIGQQSRRAYLKELKAVVDSSDVILQVLDARDPLGTKCNLKDKRMVLVLNKMDLVPKQALQAWLNFLRRSHPTIAVKAGTGNDSGSVGRAKGESALQSTSAVGMEGLLQLLKNYARNDGHSKKTCITVGIIGYPNVGKSSIINSLKRARAVGVSPKPGFTTSRQEVVLDQSVRLLDSPGVVFDDSPDALLRNCMDFDDPIAAVGALLTKCDHKSLMMTYMLPRFETVDQFLGLVAVKLGKVKSGGIPHKEAAARMVLKDWNMGKVPYFSLPPTDQLNEHKLDDAKLVQAFGPELDLTQLDNEALKHAADKDALDFVHLNSTKSGHEMDLDAHDVQDDEMESEMDLEGGERTTVNILPNQQAEDAEDFDFDEE